MPSVPAYDRELGHQIARELINTNAEPTRDNIQKLAGKLGEGSGFGPYSMKPNAVGNTRNLYYEKLDNRNVGGTRRKRRGKKTRRRRASRRTRR
jgi:hypothetical protein